jgi:hypothetical protein
MTLALPSLARPARRLAGPLACLLLAGCHVSTNNHGKNDNVDIGTPFGNVHVKTNDAANTAAIGLAVYPGAVPVKEHDGNDSTAADINMSLGSFHLGVQAASFQTPDQPDKVLAFYRKDLARYGDVIECRGDTPIGQPTRTALGLTCEAKDHVAVDGLPGKGIQLHGGTSDSSGLELRAGSERRQHIVGVDPRYGGTKISLVALDLPSHLHGRKDAE